MAEVAWVPVPGGSKGPKNTAMASRREADKKDHRQKQEQNRQEEEKLQVADVT